MAVFEAIIADGFQSVHNEGAHDRQEEIKLISVLDMGEYKLDNFLVTREGPVLIVTYMAAVERLSKGSV